jgi:hypothetical protein
MTSLVALALAGLVSAQVAASSQTAAPHDKPFWQAIVAAKYAVPAGADVPALVRELSGHLGSTDPEWRDDIAYSVLTSWIYRQRVVPVQLRRELIATWRANLTKGIGETGTDLVLLRSFSALSIATMAILDNEAGFLERAEFAEILGAAIVYLGAEGDVRGFDAAKGWMHSVAHTADLLKFLARSRHLRSEEQSRILRAITDKLGRVDAPLSHGEDERLARAVLSIAARTDFDEAGFRAWAATLGPSRPAGRTTLATLATMQNQKNFAVALYGVLSTDQRDLATIAAARAAVLAALKTFM